MLLVFTLRIGYPPIKHFPTCLIANTDPTNKPGKHWVAMYLESPGVCEFFDSYGRAPAGTFACFLQNYTSDVNFNAIRIQGPLSNSCGPYCIYYLCARIRGRTMKSIVGDFSMNLPLNDVSVSEFVRRNFDVNVKTYDMYSQTSQLE